jgi:hypothetical protein
MKSTSYNGFRASLAVGLLSCATFVCASQVGSKAPVESSFTRLVHTDKTTVALETRDVKLVPVDGHGPIIWLVSAAHIGQASYYKSIQKLLDAQSLVLFEGVKKEQTAAEAAQAPAGDAKPKTPFPAKASSTYLMLADAVGLEFQLDDIDYSHKNFENCDLTWAQVNALSVKAGKGAQSNISNIGKILDANSSEGKMFAGALQQIKADPGSQAAMRVVLAEALSKPGLLEKFLGDATTDVLIKSRNAKVLAQVHKESSKPSIAIFFGAAHMPDMERHIIDDMHYREAEDMWMPAITADESKVTGQGVAILSAFRSLLQVPKA